MMTTVAERCRGIATFRHVGVRLMETLARWTPLTPEMEAKVMFGRHIWDYAQMADQLGKRTFELRKPLHFSLRPVEAYDELLLELASARSTADRVAAFYEGLVPGLAARLERYAAETDPVLDEPSIVIVEGMVRVLERQRAEAAGLQRELHLASGSAAAIAARERAIPALVAEALPA